jgi:flagellar basal-body rod protein FlgC
MSDFIFAIARSGLDVERQRMEVIAQNLANSGTTRTGAGVPYQPLRLVSGPQMTSSFAERLQNEDSKRNATRSLPASLSGVQAYGVEQIDTPARLVYDPSHPMPMRKALSLTPASTMQGKWR